MNVTPSPDPTCEFPRPASMAWGAWLLLAVLTLSCAGALVQLQAEMTNHHPDSPDVFNLYVEHQMPDIYNARPMMRWAISGAYAALGGRLSTHQVNTGLQLLWIWAGLILTFALARRASGGSPEAWAAPFVAAAFVPWGFMRIGFSISMPYDFPCLAFGAAGLLAIISGRYLWLAAIVALGTANKETVVWVVAAWFFFNHRGFRPQWDVILKAAGLAAIFFAVYFALRLVEHGSLVTGSSMQEATGQAASAPRWRLNLDELMLRGHKRLFQNVYWPWLIHLPALVMWRRLPAGVRRLYWGAPVLMAPLALVGNLRELRLYNDLIPLGAAAAVCLVCAGARKASGPES